MDKKDDKIAELLKELDSVIKSSVKPKKILRDTEVSQIRQGLLISGRDKTGEDYGHYTYEQAQGLVREGRYKEAIICLERFLESEPHHPLASNDLGVLYLQAGDKVKALLYLEESVMADPRNMTARKNVADLHLNMGNLEEGLAIYMKVIEEKPDDIEALLKLGELCETFKRFRGARLFYKKALAFQPENNLIKGRLKRLPAERSSAGGGNKKKRKKGK